MCFAWHTEMVFTCMTKAHGSQGALLHKLVPGQVCSVTFLRARVYYKTKPRSAVLGKKNPSVKRFLCQERMEGLGPPPPCRFSLGRDSPAKTKNLLPSVDIWALFRRFPQPCVHSPYIGKPAAAKPPWSQGNLFLSSAFPHLR